MSNKKLDYNHWTRLMEVLTTEPQTIGQICAKVPEYSHQSNINMLNVMHRNDAVRRSGEHVTNSKRWFALRNARVDITPPRQIVATGVYSGLPMVSHRVGSMDAFKMPSRFNNRLTPYWGASA